MGLLDEDDGELNIDDLFHEEVIELSEEETEKQKEKNIQAEKLAQQARELQELKEQLNELKSQRVGSLTHQPAQPVQESSRPKPLKQKIKESLESGYDLAEVINMAAEEAYNAGQQASKGQYIPVAAQSARHQIARFLADNPMTASVRKEFDNIVADTSDEAFASMTPQQLTYAIDTAASVAEGKVIRKTRNTRGAEPPMYSTGNSASFGRDSDSPAKKKLTADERQAKRAVAEMAARQGFSKKEVQEMIGEIE